jgi:hypothetical protein
MRRVNGGRWTPVHVVLVPYGKDQQEPEMFAVVDTARGMFLQDAFEARTREVLAHVTLK